MHAEDMYVVALFQHVAGCPEHNSLPGPCALRGNDHDAALVLWVLLGHRLLSPRRREHARQLLWRHRLRKKNAVFIGLQAIVERQNCCC